MTMEKNNKSGSIEIKPKGKREYSFLIVNLLLLFILPLLSIIGAIIFENDPSGWPLIGKWFIFWTVGLRLFTAGIKQASNPEFTGTHIFQMKTGEGFVVIRELGFANISLGVMGILSVINDNWRVLAAISGGLFFGLAGIQHLFKKPDTQNEWIAILGDFFVFVMAALYLVFTLIM
jgi:hypothetical protein